jgi:bacterioferritin
VQQQLEGDLKDEEDAVHQYNSAMNICAEALDNGSCDLFQSTLNDEEGHADFLEAQLHAIKENGNQHLPRAAVAWREVAKSIHAV